MGNEIALHVLAPVGSEVDAVKSRHRVDTPALLRN
jgi:hypothetical protein